MTERGESHGKEVFKSAEEVAKDVVAGLLHKDEDGKFFFQTQLDDIIRQVAANRPDDWQDVFKLVERGLLDVENQYESSDDKLLIVQVAADIWLKAMSIKSDKDRRAWAKNATEVELRAAPLIAELWIAAHRAHGYDFAKSADEIMRFIVEVAAPFEDAQEVRDTLLKTAEWVAVDEMYPYEEQESTDETLEELCKRVSTQFFHLAVGGSRFIGLRVLRARVWRERIRLRYGGVAENPSQDVQNCVRTIRNLAKEVMKASLLAREKSASMIGRILDDAVRGDDAPGIAYGAVMALEGIERGREEEISGGAVTCQHLRMTCGGKKRRCCLPLQTPVAKHCGGGRRSGMRRNDYVFRRGSVGRAVP